ncbi:hypothetical protein, partial [Streptomyces sp. NPDC051776]|uniref:hypothetical protein n=1 Tax=Streptomyces sp. NPDC051776 TaxID=3155414 RepID=UPI003448852B
LPQTPTREHRHTNRRHHPNHHRLTQQHRGHARGAWLSNLGRPGALAEHPEWEAALKAFDES